jgi:zinc/manganese transport system permease protein
VAYAGASAFTILCVAKSPMGEMDVLSLVFGNVLGVTETQLYVLGALAAAVLVLHACFAKELLFTAFDADMAETMGYRVQAWEFFFYLILGVVFSLSVSIAGVLVIFSYLVIPATAALVLDVGMTATFAVAVAVAVIAGGSGVLLSYQWDLPTGPTIVAALCALLLLSGIVKQLSRLRSAQVP